MEFRRAERKRAKARILLSAPSGGGKTYSSLLLAKGLVGGDLSKVAVIDTENGSAHNYEHLGPFAVCEIQPVYDREGQAQKGFEPETFIEAISVAEREGFECIVIDSASHEWVGTNGCLELVDKVGTKFTGWKSVTPRHRNFVNRILHSSAHIICTTRKKTEWTMEQTDKGKMAPREVGLAEEQRPGFKYEFAIAFSLNQNHYASCDKDRTGLFMNKPETVLSEYTGQKLLEWLNAAPDDEIYEATEGQKNRLYNVFKLHKLERDAQIEIAGQMKGQAMARLDAVVADFLAARDELRGA